MRSADAGGTRVTTTSQRLSMEALEGENVGRHELDD